MGSNNWVEHKFETAPIEIIDGDRGKFYPNGDDFTSKGFCLFLNAKNVTREGFKFADCQYVSEDKDHQLHKGKLERGDIILTTRGTVGNVAYYSNDVPFKNIRINSGMLILRPVGEGLIGAYLYWFMRSKIFQDQVDSIRSGTAQPQLPISTLRHVSIAIPGVSIQKSIVCILDSIQSKIATNNRISQVLEEIAQALYKSWFVDFEPFQDGQFVDSELGPIPAGWRVATIESICDRLASGGTPSTKKHEYYCGDISWFSTKELQDGYLFESEKKITAEAVANSSTKLFPAGTVLMAIYAAPTVGRLGILTSEAAFNQAAVGLVTNKMVCSSEYLYLTLFAQRFNFNNMANGAAQQNLSVGIVKNYRILVPFTKVMDQFSALMDPIFSQLKQSAQENRSLVSLRDALLPKLMSGEIEIPE